MYNVTEMKELNEYRK